MEHSSKFINPMRVSRRKIIQIAEDFGCAYARLHGDIPSNLFTINFEHVYDTLIYPQCGISLETGDELGTDGEEKILGFYDVFTNTIALDAALADQSDKLSSKRAFTFWHELGHAVLHAEWMKSQFARFPDGRVVTVESSISLNSSEKLEQQANLFAAHAAAPGWFLDFVLKSTFRLDRPIFFSRPAEYWLDVRGQRRLCECNSFRELCVNIAYIIQPRFGGLSIEALVYRIQASPCVRDVSGDASPSFRLLRTAPVKVGEAIAIAS